MKFTRFNVANVNQKLTNLSQLESQRLLSFWECCYESLEKITMNQSLITSDTVDANCVEQVGINNQQYHGIV